MKDEDNREKRATWKKGNCLKDSSYNKRTATFIRGLLATTHSSIYLGINWKKDLKKVDFKIEINSK